MKKIAAKRERGKAEENVEATQNGNPTIVWGSKLEGGDWLKVPHALIRIAKYVDLETYGVRYRHIMLVLVLASRKYQNKPIRVYWEELAQDLGVSKETVRKWAYQLRDQKLLTIKNHRGRDPNDSRIGVRNERNSFDLSPFIELVESAAEERTKRKRPSRDQSGGAK